MYIIVCLLSGALIESEYIIDKGVHFNLYSIKNIFKHDCVCIL